MATRHDPRQTSVITRPGSAPKSAGDSVHSIIRLIDFGEEPRKIFAAIAECAANTPNVRASAIYLPADRSNNQQELVARAGDVTVDLKEEREDDRAGRIALQAASQTIHKISVGDHTFFDIVCLGAPIGSLVVVTTDDLSREACGKLGELAHHAGVTFERQRLSGTLQHFVDRLEVLNELNQLIASNVGLIRIVKSLARESAFRFASDLALSFLLSEDKTTLEAKGGYGCTSSAIPPSFNPQQGILGQVLQLGGHLSIPNLATYANHGLKFLEDLGIRSVELCCLEVRGETLGIILVGYRRSTTLSQHDLTRFEEFCQGAAVAIINARTQERITSYTERLEELVEQRTADLAVQTARAEEANQAKSQFLANMSHELRTPLTAIVGYSSVLVDGVFGPLNDKQRDALNAVARSSEHLKRLIDDVLNLARIESGKEVSEPTRVSVKDLLTQAHKLILQTAISKGIQLQPFSLREELQREFLYCDQKHIHQIIINLMSNAVKYTPKGGKVAVSVERIGDKIRIAVSDTGVGLSPQKLERLFERFERGEDTYSKSQEGTGIGLNLTRRLVELNGGKIGVESVQGQGSTFWILIPVATEEIAPIKAEETDIEINTRLDGLDILVVDDNKDTREVLKHILLNAGANVREASNARDGITSYQEHAPDIILTDLAMPGESGLSLIRTVRAGPLQAQVPIVVLSACAFTSDRDNAISAGASAFVPKPFRPSEVIRNVRQLTLNMAMRGNQTERGT